MTHFPADRSWLLPRRWRPAAVPCWMLLGPPRALPASTRRKPTTTARSSGSPSATARCGSELSAMACANSGWPLTCRLIPTSSWWRSAICSRTAVPTWPARRNARRLTRRSRRWSRTIRSRRSIAPPTLRPTPNMRFSAWSMASTWPRRFRPSGATSKMPTGCGNAARSTRAWRTPCSRPRCSTTTCTRWSVCMPPTSSGGWSIRKASIVIRTRWASGAGLLQGLAEERLPDVVSDARHRLLCFRHP